MAEMITNKELYPQIGQRFKEIRQLLGLSRKKLAEQLGIETLKIANIENGRITETTLFMVLRALSSNYGINDNRLIFGTGFIFAEKGPKITGEFYQNHKDLFLHIDNPPWLELLELMSISPFIRTQILAKMEYLKLLCKDQIKAFKEKTNHMNQEKRK